MPRQNGHTPSPESDSTQSSQLPAEAASPDVDYPRQAESFGSGHPWPSVPLHEKPTLAAAQASLYSGYQRLLLAEGRTEWWHERQAVLDVQLGVELLLKERLAELNPLLLVEKITDQLLVDETRRARDARPSVAWYERQGRTIGFAVALERIGGLSDVVVSHRRSLEQLGAMRNQVAHTGLASAGGVRALLIVDVSKFIQEFLSSEFALDARTFVGEELWRQVGVLAGAVDDEFHRAVQRKIARSREPLHASVVQGRFTMLDLERLGRAGGYWFESNCPGCGGWANAAIVWDTKSNAQGQPMRGPDGNLIPAFWPYIARLECTSCDLELEGRELNDYLELADEELAHHFGPDWRRHLTRN